MEEESQVLLVEKFFSALYIKLYAIKGNKEYLILEAGSCGEFLSQKFPLIENECLPQTLDRAISVCSITFTQLATMEYIARKETYGNIFIN